MDIEGIKQAIKTYYPYAIGAILTGSQSTETNFDRSKDIDVLIIDPAFPIRSSFVTKHRGYNFDFTQIPLFNIENILINESFESHGIVINMFINGQIIFDTESHFVAETITFVNDLYNQSSFSKNENFKKCIIALKKMRKQFSKNLETHEKFFIINDFFYTMVQAHLFKFNHQVNGGLYNAKELYKLDKQFVNELTKLTNESLQDEDIPHKIHAYIGIYVDTFTLERKKELSYLVIDMHYANISIKDFVKNVLPLVKKHPSLGRKFSYFFSSPTIYYYIYRYPISIVFLINEDDNYDSFVYELDKLLSEYSQKRPWLSLTPTSYHAHKFKKTEFQNLFCEFLSENSLISEQLIQQNDTFDPRKFLLIAIIQITFIAGILKIQTDDLLKLNFNRCNQYLFNAQDQAKLKFPGELLELQKERYEKFNIYYQTEQAWIDAALKIGLNAIADEDALKGKLYNRSIELLRNIISSTDLNETFNNDKISYHLLVKELKNTAIDSALFYLNVTEYIFQSLNLNSWNTSLCMFISSTAIHNIKNSQSKVINQ